MKTSNNNFLIRSKILEESEELICAQGDSELIHESADLLYFMLLYLMKNNIAIEEVECELIKRRYSLIKSDYDIKHKNPQKFKIGIIQTNIPKNFSIEFLMDIFSTKIYKKNDSDRSYELICENNNLQIIVVKPKDVALLINNGFIDAIVSYEDIILNYSVNAEKVLVNKNKNKKVSIVLVCKEGVTIEKLKQENEGRKLIIMAEYVRLTSEWVRKNNIKAKICHVNGSSESYLANDLCDLCVVVCDTGVTLKENGLKILDCLVSTNINLFVHPDKKKKLFDIQNIKDNF